MCEVVYTDTLAYEHVDNLRFMRAVEKWIGRDIKILRSKQYRDIYDVFDRTGWLIGPQGARCTTELTRQVRRIATTKGGLMHSLSWYSKWSANFNGDFSGDVEFVAPDGTRHSIPFAHCASVVAEKIRRDVINWAEGAKDEALLYARVNGGAK